MREPDAVVAARSSSDQVISQGTPGALEDGEGLGPVVQAHQHHAVGAAPDERARGGQLVVQVVVVARERAACSPAAASSCASAWVAPAKMGLSTGGKHRADGARAAAWRARARRRAGT